MGMQVGRCGRYRPDSGGCLSVYKVNHVALLNATPECDDDLLVFFLGIPLWTAVLLVQPSPSPESIWPVYTEYWIVSSALSCRSGQGQNWNNNECRCGSRVQILSPYRKERKALRHKHRAEPACSGRSAACSMLNVCRCLVNGLLDLLEGRSEMFIHVRVQHPLIKAFATLGELVCQVAASDCGIFHALPCLP